MITFAEIAITKENRVMIVIPDDVLLSSGDKISVKFKMGNDNMYVMLLENNKRFGVIENIHPELIGKLKKAKDFLVVQVLENNKVASYPDVVVSF